MNRTVTIDYTKMVEISCKMSDNPNMKGQSQGFIEWLLSDAIRSVTGVDFFEAEKLITEKKGDH